jgi:hypothetical protein
MRTISTRQVETPEEKVHIYALRYDYYVVERELDIVADHALRLVRDARDTTALHFGTYAGDDIVGGFRAEIGAPNDLTFGADWAFSDFLDDMPARAAIFSGLCISPYLRDDRVAAHMVRESVAFARELDLPHIFFEMSPDLWPEFHAAGLLRKGGALTDRQTGLKTAVFHLRSPVHVRPEAQVAQTIAPTDGANDDQAEEYVRPRLAVVRGGRR